jgi:hypothetical protein
VVPEGGDLAAAGIRVDQLRVRRRLAAVRPRRIDALDEVVPCVPLPDDPASCGPDRLDLDDCVREQVLVREQRGAEARLERLLPGLALDHEREHIAIGQRRDVMVELGVARGVVELPDEVALPVVLLDPASLASTRATTLDLDHAGTEHVTVREQVGRLPWHVLAVPGAHNLTVVVDQVSARVVLRRDERIARRGSPRVMNQQADRLRGSRRAGSPRAERRHGASYEHAPVPCEISSRRCRWLNEVHGQASTGANRSHRAAPKKAAVSSILGMLMGVE